MNSRPLPVVLQLGRDHGAHHQELRTTLGCRSSSRNTCSRNGLVIWAYTLVFWMFLWPRWSATYSIPRPASRRWTAIEWRSEWIDLPVMPAFSAYVLGVCSE